jgi:hypothetical protein
MLHPRSSNNQSPYDKGKDAAGQESRDQERTRQLDMVLVGLGHDDHDDGCKKQQQQQQQQQQRSQLLLRRDVEIGMRTGGICAVLLCDIEYVALVRLWASPTVGRKEWWYRRQKF